MLVEYSLIEIAVNFNATPFETLCMC